MPLAALLGPEPAELARIGGVVAEGAARRTPCSSASAISTSARRWRSAIRGVHVFTMKDIDRQGIASIVEQAVNLAGNGTAGIHVSFDMDVCDPLIAPGVGTPVKGGLDYREAHMVMEIVADSGLLTSLDLVEVNPTLDVRNTTAQLGDRAGAVGARDEDSVSLRLGEHLFERLDEQHQRVRLLDQPRARPQPLELGRLRRHAGEDDHRHVGGRRRRRRRGPIRGAAAGRRPRRRAGASRSASSPSSAVSAVTTAKPCISRNFTSGRRTETSSSTTSTRRAASLSIIGGRFRGARSRGDRVSIA